MLGSKRTINKIAARNIGHRFRFRGSSDRCRFEAEVDAERSRDWPDRDLRASRGSRSNGSSDERRLDMVASCRYQFHASFPESTDRGLSREGRLVVSRKRFGVRWAVGQDGTFFVVRKRWSLAFSAIKHL
jgi:hypothetical protein